MKISLLLILFFHILTLCNALTNNEIDSIMTDSDVASFVKKHFEHELPLRLNEKYHHKTSQMIADSLGLKFWGKADFDSNGLMDLYIIRKFQGYSFFAILAFEDGKYKKVDLMKFTECLPTGDDFPIVDIKNKVPIVYLHSVDYCQLSLNEGDGSSIRPEINIDSLVYWQGEFIEKYIKHHKVEKIEIEYYSWGWETKYAIKRNKSVKYTKYFLNPLRHPFTYRIHKKKIEANQFDNLWLITEYIDWDKLSSNYKIKCCEDATGAVVRVYYDDKIKEISDYGLIGTCGLAIIHRWIDDWYKTSLDKEKED